MDAAPRIIDANANRAREALRVLEDAARFALDSEPLARRLKELRHDLRAAIDSLPVSSMDLLHRRDTPNDVGTAISTPAETSRHGVPDVAAAAAKRLTEALRSIEEYAKPSSPSAAALVESIRYRAYEAERALLVALAAGRAPHWKLCVLITESLCTHHPWDDVARLAAAAGADCLQLREKSLADSELLARARRLVDLARTATRAGDPPPSVIVNDRPDIALLAGADGVHLGQGDLPVREARTLCGQRLLIGLSTSGAAQARAAFDQGADYVGLGPMFPSSTKHKDTIAGPAALREFLRDPALADLPYLAIGGIGPQNLPALAAVGCRSVAVSSAVCSSPDPAAACRALLDMLPAPAH